MLGALKNGRDIRRAIRQLKYVYVLKLWLGSVCFVVGQCLFCGWAAVENWRSGGKKVARCFFFCRFDVVVEG